MTEPEPFTRCELLVIGIAHIAEGVTTVVMSTVRRYGWQCGLSSVLWASRRARKREAARRCQREAGHPR